MLPPGNTVQQWDKIAEDTVVGSGAFQNEGLDLHGLRLERDVPRDRAGRAARASRADAAVVEAAYTTLSHYFPAQAATLDALHARGACRDPERPAKVVGHEVRRGGRRQA